VKGSHVDVTVNEIGPPFGHRHSFKVEE
jgi:hypothetical protein